MADDVKDPIDTTTPAGAPEGRDPSAVPDPRDAELAELRAYAAQVGPIIDRLRPYEEDVKALLEGDDDYRSFQRSSRESYYDMKKRQEAERDAAIPESEKRLLGALDERLGKFKPVLDDYESRAKAKEAADKEATGKFVSENLEYAQRLIKDEGLSEAEVNDLSRFAKVLHDESVTAGAPRFVGLEEVYKRVYGRAETKTAAATPRSLRAKAGATGVPGASKPADTRGVNPNRPGDLTKHMLGVLNGARKTG